MTETKRVEIVFPVHNRREITLQCLRSLARIEQDNLEVHLIMVDDGSTDGTSEAVAKEFPEVEIIKGDGNLWFTEGTNVGVRAALKHQPDYVLMMNDDQVFDSKFLTYMIETAEKYPRTVVGALLLLWDTPHRLFQVSPSWETFSGGWRHWYRQTIWTIPKKPWQVEIIVGNCVLVPIQAIREQGIMDEKHFPNMGDAEYTPRLRKKGWQLLIDPRARVFCQPNNQTPTIRKLPWRTFFNDLFIDLGKIHNLRRRWYASLAGAPNRLQGALAFVFFLLRLGFGNNPEKVWVKANNEKPLSEIVAGKILDA